MTCNVSTATLNATGAPGVTLAGHSRASKLQAGSAGPPVSARQGANVPIKLQTVVEDSSFLCLSARLAH